MVAKKVVWKADRGATYRVMRENGPHSPNRTDNMGQVTGADMGHMFVYQGKIYTIYNDNFGGPEVPLGTDFFADYHHPSTGAARPWLYRAIPTRPTVSRSTA